MNRIDRNKILVRHLIELGIANSQAELGKLLGYNNSCGFSQLLNEKKPYPKNFTTKLKSLLPSLNIEWLENGVGEMLVTSDMDVVAKNNSDVIEVNAEEVAQIANFSLPFATNDMVQAPNLDIKALVQANSPKLDRYPIGKKLSGASYAQRIVTEAMSGADFYPGDIIILRYLEDESQITSGYAYLLDTKRFGALFRKITIKDNGFLLESCNPNFEPIFLREDDIYSYAALIMQIRTSFKFAQNAQLAEMVRARDAQISNMASAQQQMLDTQTELIAEIRKLGERIEKERERTNKLTDKLLKE